MKKKQGFTLVELLVVIAIIALLMGILMPALARVRQVAYRMVSGTNQAGIGKAMLIYANDNEGDYPVAGSRWVVPSTQNKIKKWDAEERKDAFTGFNPANMSLKSQITVGSCFYLLVKYADVAPKQFVNRSDVGVKEFKMSEYSSNIADDITDPWDFGTEPAVHVSYSYHYPFFGTGVGAYSTSGFAHYPVTQQSNPSTPVISDRNPYVDKNATHVTDPALANPKWDPTAQMFVDTAGKANAACHQLEGQNVLFNDTHVRFEKLSNCGINNDNIFVSWDGKPATGTAGQQLKEGIPNVNNFSMATLDLKYSWDEEDAFLVSDPTK